YPFLSACRVASPRSHSFPTRRSSDLCPPSRSWLRRQHPAVRGSGVRVAVRGHLVVPSAALSLLHSPNPGPISPGPDQSRLRSVRSEEHTSELQSRFDLVCRLLLEKKN